MKLRANRTGRDDTDIVLWGVLGWHLGGRPSEPPPREPSPTARIGPASITVPPEWDPAPLSRTDVELGNGVPARAFDLEPGLSARGVVLVAPPADGTLLPAALRATTRR